MQMPNLLWTHLTSTHTLPVLPPTSCLVKFSKLYSVLTMVLSKQTKTSCESTYKQGDLQLPLTVSGSRKQSHRGRRAPNYINRKTRNLLSFLCPLLLLESISIPNDLMNFYPLRSVTQTHPKSGKVRNTPVSQSTEKLAFSSSLQIFGNGK